MFRALIIFATVLATLFGSIGMPVVLYACGMGGESITTAPACAMCRKHSVSASPVSRGAVVRATPCCTRFEIRQQSDLSILTETQALPTPVLVGLLAAASHDLPDRLAFHSGNPYSDRPPPLIERSRHTYLFNSAFLI